MGIPKVGSVGRHLCVELKTRVSRTLRVRFLDSIKLIRTNQEQSTVIVKKSYYFAIF